MIRRYALAAILTVTAFIAGLAMPPGTVTARETVHLAEGTAVAISTPPFIQVGKRYAFTWSGGGPPQTHTIKSVRKDGWVEVQVAEENVDPAFLVPGQTPTRWLNAALATSIQEMRPLPY
jgi:hypothetical protein